MNTTLTLLAAGDIEPDRSSRIRGDSVPDGGRLFERRDLLLSGGDPYPGGMGYQDQAGLGAC